jgi:hypothetical protein
MPTEAVTTNERVVPEAPEIVRAHEEDEAFRTLAVRHLEDVRKLKMRTLEFLVVLLFLTPVWVVTQYADADGWPERLSSQSNPGDWDPWILWVALIGGVLLGISAVRTYFSRPPSEVEIEREIERLRKAR